MVVGIFVAAVHTAVAVVVNAAVAHVQLVHHVNHAHNNLWVVCSVAVNLYVEYVSAASHIVVRSLNLSLVACRALVVNGHVVRVGVIVAIGNTWNHAKLFAILLCEFSAQSLGWCGQHAVVMVESLAELIHALAHVSYYLKSQLLSLFALAVVLAYKRYQTLSQSDESDAQCTLIDNALDGIQWLQLVGTYPQVLHQQWELLGIGCLLEVETVVKLLCCNLQHLVELCKEHVYTLLLVLLLAALQRQFHYVDGREAQVSATDAGLWSESVLKHTCAASHCGHLVYVALWVVGLPLLVLIECSVQIQEVREESAGCNLTGQLIEVEVAILGQIVHAALLLPYLNGEDGGLAVTHALVGAQQYLAHHAAALGTCVGSVVDT